jgi:hypothetical protein
MPRETEDTGHWFKCNLSIPPQIKKLTKGKREV